VLCRGAAAMANDGLVELSMRAAHFGLGQLERVLIGFDVTAVQG
jgi:hypothetical protein